MFLGAYEVRKTGLRAFEMQLETGTEAGLLRFSMADAVSLSMLMLDGDLQPFCSVLCSGQFVF